LIYVLAILFVLVAAFALLQVVFIVMELITEKFVFQLQHWLVVFIFLFTIIRAIHLFLIPSGLNSNVADYILGSLPTFFYFTAYSLVVVVWATVTLKPISQENFSRTILTVAGIVNGVLYAMFVAIVLVFNFIKPGASDDTVCKGRVVGATDDSDVKLKRIVSIVYAVIVAFISLVTGVGFLIFGLRLWKNMKRSSHKKIMIITAVCSGALILHCVFILVLVGLPKPSLPFTFVGLIVTEIAPTAFLLFVFKNLKKKSSGSSTSGNSVSSVSPRSDSGSRSKNSGSSDSDEVIEMPE